MIMPNPTLGELFTQVMQTKADTAEVTKDVLVNQASCLDANKNVNFNIGYTMGIGFNKGSNVMYLSSAPEVQVKEGTYMYRAIVPGNQHMATFYGLAKAAGDSTQAESSNAVGVYTDNAKTAIRSMIGATDTGTVSTMINSAINSNAVPIFMGSGNVNKQLVVDASGYVTTGETTGSIIGENIVKYMPTRTIYVGSNLIDGSTSASGVGWSGDFTNGFIHTSGNTEPLVIEVSTTANTAYIVEFDHTNYAEDAVFVSIGNSPMVDVYHGVSHAFTGIVSDGGYLKIYTKSSYTGTITNIIIRPIAESGTELTQTCREVTHGSNTDELSGWNNVAIAADALGKNINGSRNIAIGYGAAGKIISGNRNVCIGNYAMPFVSEGDRNISIGSDTLYNPSISSGTSKAYDNIAIGKATMRNGEIVQNNIALGRGAMAQNDLNANGNVAIGVRAGYYAKNYNTFIGYQAGYWIDGENNVCIGRDAGNNAYITGDNNIFIGSGAKASISGASSSNQKTINNSIGIGKDVYVNDSNSIVIGKYTHTIVKIAGKTLSFNQDGSVTWS